MLQSQLLSLFFVKARKSHFFFPLSHLFLQLKDSNEHLLIFQRCLIMFSTIDLKISKKAKNLSLQTKWVSFEKPFKIKYHRQKKLEVINNARLATSIATHCLKITSKKSHFTVKKQSNWNLTFHEDCKEIRSQISMKIQMRQFFQFFKHCVMVKVKMGGTFTFL